MNARQQAQQKEWAKRRRAKLAARTLPMDRHPLYPVLVAAAGAYRLSAAGIHGPLHWLRVLRNGREITAHTPWADLVVVEHFALPHDCRRQDDSADPFHGERAARFVETIADRLTLDDAQRTLLIDACAGHEHGEVSDDPTIGCCWDADRLELSRLGRRPIAELLSTQAARRADIQTGAWVRGIKQTKESL